MDTTYEDITNEVIRAGGGVQQPSPLVVCELQKAYRGRFCFPFGAGFGCGLELKLSAGVETNLMAQFNVPPVPVRAAITFKVAVEVVYRSHRCEYCRPKVCVEATIDVWKCERFLGFWSWTTIDTVFTPSIQPIFLTDCTPNDPLCNCPQRTAMLRTGEDDSRTRFALLEDEGGREAQARGIGEVASASALVSPATFAPAVGGMSLPPEKVAQLASQHVEGLFEEYPDARVAVLRNHQQASWISGDAADAPQLTLLSRGAWDAGRLRVSEGLPRLPVLAVAPAVPGAHADVRVTAERQPERPEEIFKGDASVITGRATTVWTDVDLAQAGLPAGTKGNVTVTLRDPSKRTIGRLVEPFVVTPKWRADGP
jgi:hypothetical protein